MEDVLYRLDKEWKRNNLHWVEWDKAPSMFERLAKDYIPGAVFLARALHFRTLLYHAQKRKQEVGLYTVDSWC